MHSEPGFDLITLADKPVARELVVGLAGPDLAALSAIDYLIEQSGAELVGHVRTVGLPDVAVIKDGSPRQPLRIYTDHTDGLTILIGEAIIPIRLVDQFATALGHFIEAFQSITVLHAAPFPHREEEHIPFLAATDGYRDATQGMSLNALPTGLLDGFPGEALLRAMNGSYPPCGIVITPAHMPGPDINAGVTLIEGMNTVLGRSVDVSGLQERAEQMENHFAGLADRITSLRENEMSTRDFPEDRMYM